MTLLCRYASAGGSPGEGVHVHVLGVAAFDVAGTLLAAWLLARAFRQPFWAWALGLFALGVLAHRLFCVRTTVDRLLFG